MNKNFERISKKFQERIINIHEYKHIYNHLMSYNGMRKWGFALKLGAHLLRCIDKLNKMRKEKQNRVQSSALFSIFNDGM